MPPSHFASAEALAEQVMRLLEVRQTTAIPAFAAASLAQLCGAGTRRVLRVFPIAAARLAQGEQAEYALAPDAAHPDDVPIPAGGDADLLQALRTRRPVRSVRDNGRSRFIVPL